MRFAKSKQLIKVTKNALDTLRNFKTTAQVGKNLPPMAKKTNIGEWQHKRTIKRKMK